MVVSDNVEDIDDIYDEDADYLEADKSEGEWYLGMIGNVSTGHRVLCNTISPSAFFKFSYPQVCNYLTTYSLMDPERVLPGVRIIQLRMHPEGYYLAVDKTVIICRIQRWWRVKYRQFRASLARQLRFREERGFFPVHRILK